MNPSCIVPIEIDGRTFRLIFSGPQSMLGEAAAALAQAATVASTEDEFLGSARTILRDLGCEIVETRDLTPPSSRPPLIDLLRYAAERHTAQQSWAVIKAVMLDTNEEALQGLVTAGDLTFVQDLIHDISGDLDEDCGAERSVLRKQLPPPYDYILMGPADG